MVRMVTLRSSSVATSNWALSEDVNRAWKPFKALSNPFWVTAGGVGDILLFKPKALVDQEGFRSQTERLGHNECMSEDDRSYRWSRKLSCGDRIVGRRSSGGILAKGDSLK